jgi:aminoglycoside phosphotransferase (APT) family kinase protein
MISTASYGRTWDHEDGNIIVQTHARTYLFKFTHGDLAPRNVLAHKGRISAIIDWDC